MRKAGVIILILLLGITVILTAQEGDPSVEVDWDYSTDLYAAGDQTFIISLGVVFPVAYFNNGSMLVNNFSPVGGSGSLVLNYYLNSTFFIGGEISGFFIGTIAESTLFVIPIGFRAGMQFIAGSFEFPVNLTTGIVWHNYLDYGYFGIYFKASGAVYYRALPQWSFGLTSDIGWYPEWTSSSSKNVDGFFINLMVSARYHY